MNVLKQLEEMQKDLDALATEKAKAEGKVEQALANIKELGYDSEEEAREAADRLEKEKAEAEAEAEELLASLREEYKEFIA